jgi:hypothetical protein
MSGINSGHHYLPKYEISLKLDNVEFVRYCGVHFENGDRYTLLNGENQIETSLSTHISNFDDIGQKWPPQYRKKSSSEFVTMQSVHLNCCQWPVWEIS